MWGPGGHHSASAGRGDDAVRAASGDRALRLRPAGPGSANGVAEPRTDHTAAGVREGLGFGQVVARSWTHHHAAHRGEVGKTVEWLLRALVCHGSLRGAAARAAPRKRTRPVGEEAVSVATSRLPRWPSPGVVDRLPWSRHDGAVLDRSLR